MKYIVIYLIIVNLLTCIIYGIDKLKAVGRARRTPERVLLGFAFAGGSLGALLGMQLFRHKTHHWRFRILVPLFLVLHIAVIIFVYIRWLA